MTQRRRLYIGLATTFHDPAIALVGDDGEVLFAEAAERYLQYKRAPNCDPAPITYLTDLLKRHARPDDEIVVATSWSDRFTRFLDRRAEEGLFTVEAIAAEPAEFTPDLVDARVKRALTADLHLMQKRAGNAVAVAVSRLFGHCDVTLRRYGHHDTHAAYGCYTAPFDNAACLVVDGMGETGASALYAYDGSAPKLVKRYSGNESIGFYFGLVTELCGWDPAKGEEWKVMGLAPYGKGTPEIGEQVARLLRVKDGAVVASSRETIADAVAQLRAIEERMGAADFQAELARESQDHFERLMRALLAEAETLTDVTNLVFCGGCALNSSFTGKIATPDGPVRNVHVPSAPADDGNAIGAALMALAEDNAAAVRRQAFLTPYLGRDLSNADLGRIVDNEPRLQKLGDGVVARTAQCLADGKLVGWVQGRAEFGPRALGNRSILADARPAGAKDMINAKVKFREHFRPFAPSILAEYGPDWFENHQLSPYMERTLKFRPEVRDRVPAVVHADGTGRLQSVRREWNPRYYDLIEAFREITGVPLVLNTSFNIMGKPILHSAEDALLMFYTTGIDVLVIGDWIIEK